MIATPLPPLALRNLANFDDAPSIPEPLGRGIVMILIRIFVVGLLVLVAACGGEPGVDDVCGSCPEGLAFDSCKEVYNVCTRVPTRTARNLCFDQLGSPCDEITE